MGTRTEVTASVYRHTQLEAKCTIIFGELLSVLESRSYTVSAWQTFPNRALNDRTNYFILVNLASAKYLFIALLSQGFLKPLDTTWK